MKKELVTAWQKLTHSQPAQPQRHLPPQEEVSMSWQMQPHNCEGGYLVYGIQRGDVLDVFTEGDQLTRFTVIHPAGSAGYADEGGTIPMIHAKIERFQFVGEQWRQIPLAEDIQSAPVQLFAGPLTIRQGDRISYSDIHGRFASQTISPGNVTAIVNSRLS